MRKPTPAGSRCVKFEFGFAHNAHTKDANAGFDDSAQTSGTSQLRQCREYNHLVHSAKLYANQVEIVQFPVLQDNYGILIHDRTSGSTATIDTPDASAILEECDKRGWALSHILNTHHHEDHAGVTQPLFGHSYSCLKVAT